MQVPHGAILIRRPSILFHRQAYLFAALAEILPFCPFLAARVHPFALTLELNFTASTSSGTALKSQGILIPRYPEFPPYPAAMYFCRRSFQPSTTDRFAAPL